MSMAVRKRRSLSCCSLYSRGRDRVQENKSTSPGTNKCCKDSGEGSIILTGLWGARATLVGVGRSGF